jgi:hypothetical protein
MIRRMFRARADLIAGLAIIGVSVAVAIWMHRTDDSYSCLRAPCNPTLIGYPLKERLAAEWTQQNQSKSISQETNFYYRRRMA